MMKYKLEDFTPTGMDMKKIYMKIGVIFAVPILFSLQFFYHFQNAKSVQMNWMLISGIEKPMANYVEILDGSFVVFPFAMLGCLAVAVPMYRYYYQGSKSIYVMKRLSNPYEIWRRVFTIPIISALTIGFIGIVILIGYYFYYMQCSPVGSVNPNQWSILIEAWLKGGVL